MDNALKLLGLALKAGRLEVGEEPVGAVARARKAKLLILASDAAPNTVRRAAHFGEAGNVLFLTTPFTKAELGFSVGRSSCAMMAFTDPGFAASFTKKLAALDPDRYAPASEQVGKKAEKALQRQKEQRQHEKNLRERKVKPWAAPPAEKRPAQSQKKTGKAPSPSGRTSSAGKGTKPSRSGQKAAPAKGRRTQNS